MQERLMRGEKVGLEDVIGSENNSSTTLVPAAKVEHGNRRDLEKAGMSVATMI